MVGYVLVVDVLDSGNAAYPAVNNFVDLYEGEVEGIVIFGPSEADVPRDGVEVVTVPRDPPDGVASRAVDYAGYQLRLAAELFRARERLDAVFFHVGGSSLLLPLAACRLAGLPTNVFVLGSPGRSYYETHDRGLRSSLMVGALSALEWVTCRLADRVLVLTEGMDSPGDGRLSTAERTAANLNYVDCDRFDKRRPMDERQYDLVFVGRFERVKGVTKLARGLTRLVDRRPETRACLVGDGSLREEVEAILRDGGAADRVDLVGWVDHDEIPSYFAESRTLVLPSESEGLPKSILEAMACATVPVATPVGGVGDVVDDGEIGFLLPDNDPGTIADALDRVLDRNDLDAIGDRAREYVGRTYSYEATAETFEEFLPAGEPRRSPSDRPVGANRSDE